MRVVREVVREEIRGALKKMKGDKAAGVDSIVVMLKNGAIIIIDWLMRIFNKCMEFGVVPEDWKAACIVYKGQATVEIVPIVIIVI